MEMHSLVKQNDKFLHWNWRIIVIGTCLLVLTVRNAGNSCPLLENFGSGVSNYGCVALLQQRFVGAGKTIFLGTDDAPASSFRC